MVDNSDKPDFSSTEQYHLQQSASESKEARPSESFASRGILQQDNESSSSLSESVGGDSDSRSSDNLISFANSVPSSNPTTSVPAWTKKQNASGDEKMATIETPSLADSTPNHSTTDPTDINDVSSEAPLPEQVPVVSATPESNHETICRTKADVHTIKLSNKDLREGPVVMSIIVALIVGGIITYFATQFWESIMPSTMELTFTAQPSLSSTSSPSEFPTTAFRFDPPLKEDCDRIRKGEDVSGQDSLIKQSFEITLDVAMQVSTSQSETMDTLEMEIQKRLMPKLVGCGDTPIMNLRHNRKLSTPYRYIVGNGKVHWRLASLEDNPECSFEICLSASFDMDLFLKSADNMIENLLGDFFGDDLVDSLKLESPPFISVVVRSVTNRSPTMTPSSTPSLLPSVSSLPTQSELPSNLPEFAPSEAVPSAVVSTSNPTTTAPTLGPTLDPTPKPTPLPSLRPSIPPTRSPTRPPTAQPSLSPSIQPTSLPTTEPTFHPSVAPSTSPPTSQPTLRPTRPLTRVPTVRPSESPSSSPTVEEDRKGYYKPLDRAIRIACVGDSLTRGVSNLYGLGRAVDYPKQLQGLLGGTYTLRNLGINAVTAIRGLSTSYTDRWGFETSLTYQPDIYLLMLGTNDSSYWETHGQKYRSDMEWIVRTVKAETGARIIVGIPPYVKDPASGYGQIRNQILVNYIQPAIRDLAISEKVEIVDMYKVTVNEPHALTNDGVHLNEKGYGILAEAWRSTIQCNQNGICDVGENCMTCPRDCHLNCG